MIRIEGQRVKYSTTNSGLPAGNPIANIFVVIIGALAIAATVILGFFAFVIVSSIVLVMAFVIGLRVWWFKRKFQKSAADGAEHRPAQPGGVIEGEYRVIADEDEGE